ncbi:ovochymase-2 [Sphaeramia orbicularis]|uniref:ovochymase-2 n=1 Tax=Sphaeramia orbicularis TaxID=375764 RepID=UPI00117C38F3|nr:ovochymase-2-like [Sphaeramia orbicularis]
MSAIGMRITAAVFCLCFWVNAGIHATRTGPKCGAPQVWSPMGHFMRVVGGTESTYGRHPWLVSLRNKGFHFCGGSILSERWIITAAHCFSSLSKEFLSGVKVVVGDFDLRVTDEEEQVFHIKTVWVHEKYQRTLPMTYDVALLELDRHIHMGNHVQPICLPLPDDNTPPETSCIVGGWGRMREKGHLPSVLREVQLDLVDPSKCKRVLQTVKSSVLTLGPNGSQPAMTVLCAGPERGGRDACQGDSGGPLVCPAGSAGGHLVALGITSWGKGCGRSWEKNRSLPPSRRGSPGLFTDVRLLLPWIKEKLKQGDEQHPGLTSSRLCSVKDGSVTDIEGVIRNPALPGDCYDNNELCVWNIRVPPGFSILLELDHLDLENDSYCRYDRLSVSVGAHRPVGIFCGGILPSQVLLNNSHHATLLFSSDISVAGSGFVMRHRAVQGNADPACRIVILVEHQSTVHSPNYPQSYSNDCVIRWVVYAPLGHVIKLEFADFDLEESDGCLYDSLTVLGDVEGTEEIALLCGSSVPPPVLSYHSVMVLQFTSDGSVTHKGFRAGLQFISQSDLHHQGGPFEQSHSQSHTEDLEVNQQRSTSHVDVDAAEPVRRQRGSRVQPHLDDVDPTPEDSTEHVDVGPDDEDYVSESSGTEQ